MAEYERGKQRIHKKQMNKTEVNYNKNVPDISGNLGYPRIDHMTSSEEWKKEKFNKKFFMGDLDNQLDLKQKRIAEDKKRDNTYYVLQNDIDAVGDQHHSKTQNGFFGSRAVSQGRQ